MQKLTKAQIMHYITESLDDDVVDRLFDYISNGRHGNSLIRDYNDLDLIISVLSNDKFNDRQIDIILDGIELDLPIEKIMTYSNPDISWESMMFIRDGYVRGLDIDDIKPFISALYSPDQICYIVSELTSKYGRKTTSEQMRYIANPDLSPAQMEQVKLGIWFGLSKDQINKYAKSEYSPNVMNTMRTNMIDNMSNNM